MKWHETALTPATRRAAEMLRSSEMVNDFYLAGGTALALQLGHRFSEDLDFFSATNPLASIERAHLLRRLKSLGETLVHHENDGWLQIQFKGISATFLRYDYPLIRKPLDWQAISVASMEDIALMKINAIIGRGTKRDFVDLYAICRQMDLGELISLANQKYPDHREFLVQASYALVYFADAEKDRMPRLIQNFDWKAIKGFFLKEVPKVFKNRLLT